MSQPAGPCWCSCAKPTPIAELRQILVSKGTSPRHSGMGTPVPMIFPIRLGLIITLGSRRRVDSAYHKARATTDPVRFVPRLAGTVDPYRNLATLLWNHFPALR